MNSRVSGYLERDVMKIEPPRRIATGAVVLRELRADDASAYTRAFKEDRDLGRLLGMERDPSEDRVRQRCAQLPERALAGEFVELVVADPASDELQETVNLHSFAWQHRRCEVGFWLSTAARGRGLGAAAVAAMIEWAFSTLGLLRIEMTTTPDNVAVPALARRLGFTLEGVARKRNVERGRRIDVVSYGLLREEWRSRS